MSIFEVRCVMTGDLLQALSLALVAGALAFSAWQARTAARQSREATRQTALTGVAVRQVISQETTRHRVDFTFTALKDDPEMTAWFLGSRSLPVSDILTNKVTLWLYAKLDVHQSMHMQHSARTIPEEVWTDWVQTLRLDVTSDQFGKIWPIARSYYPEPFVAFVDLVRTQAGRPHPTDYSVSLQGGSTKASASGG
jgi:hypothetical protein